MRDKEHPMPTMYVALATDRALAISVLSLLRTANLLQQHRPCPW
jgi:hypothetical protein